MVTIPVEIPSEAIAAFCQRNHIRKLSLFGSILTDRFRDDSDVDLLVEMDSGRSLIDLVGLGQDLEDLLGTRVDVLSAAGVSTHLRERIVGEAVPL